MNKLITRRRFVSTVAASAVIGPRVVNGTQAGAATVAEQSSHPHVRPNILYALSTGSWGRVVEPGQPLPLLKILDETAAGGFNGVRLTGYPNILDQNNLSEEQYGDALEKRGLRFSTISFGGPYHDPAQHNDILERARRALALHRRYGATAAVFFPPGVTPPAEEKETLRQCCKFFNRMGKMAVEEYGIKMGLHNHTDSLVENQRQVDQYLDDTDPRYVFCAWDTAHLYLGGCDVEKTFENSLDRIVYTDFKDATRSPSGEDYVAPNGVRVEGDSHSGKFFNSIVDLGHGEIDFPPLMRMLKRQGYRGWVNHDLDTIRVSCAESWRIAMEYIREKLDPIYA